MPTFGASIRRVRFRIRAVPLPLPLPCPMSAAGAGTASAAAAAAGAASASVSVSVTVPDVRDMNPSSPALRAAFGGLLPSRRSRFTALYPRSARYDIVREGVQSRQASGAQCQTRHVPGDDSSPCPVAASAYRERDVGWAWAHHQTPSGRENATTPVNKPPIHAHPTLNCDVLAPFAVDGLRVLCDATLRWSDVFVFSTCDALAPLAPLRFYPSIPNAPRIFAAAAVALIVPSTTSRSRSLSLRRTSGCSRTAVRTP